MPASQCSARRSAESDSQAAEQPEPGTVVLTGKQERNQRDAQAPLGLAARDTAGRVAASLGALDGQAPHFEPAATVSGADVLTALPALLQQGLLRHAGCCRLRQLMQTLRMLAYRAETCMAVTLAPELDNPETARSLLKALFRSEAGLLPDLEAGTLTVRLPHQASRAQDAALAPLLAELNRTRTVFPGTQLRLVYELPSSGCHQPMASQPPPARVSAQIGDNSNRKM